MRDSGLAIDQVVVVLGIKDGDANVLTCESLNVGSRRPPADRHDVRPAVAEIPRPQPGTEVYLASSGTS
jgi:hypothetical protein